MPLPFIVAGIAVGAGIYGVYKGVKATRNFGEAKDVNKSARFIYDDATESLERCRDETQAALMRLGEEKASLVEHSLMPFVQAFKRLKHVDYSEFEMSDENLANIGAEVLEIREISVEMAKICWRSWGRPWGRGISRPGGLWLSRAIRNGIHRYRNRRSLGCGSN